MFTPGQSVQEQQSAHASKVVETLDEALLETKLLRLFSWKDFEHLQLPPFAYPKMLRGLPRFYDKKAPSKASVKKPFSTFFQLKKHYVDKAKLYTYRGVVLKKPLQLTVFSQIKTVDGEEIRALHTLMEILEKSRLPIVCTFLLAFPKGYTQDMPIKNVLKVSYIEGKALKLTKQAVELLDRSDVVLQYPYYSKTCASHLQSSSFAGQSEMLGCMGSLEEAPFLEEGRSLGLHFLEKGILQTVRKRYTSQDLLSSVLARRLFDQKPTKKALTKYLSKWDLNYFDVRSLPALLTGCNYLLQKRKGDKKHLDLMITTHLGMQPLFQYLEKHSAFLDVSTVEVYSGVAEDLKKETWQYAGKARGKKLRIFVLENLPIEERHLLIDLTKDLLIIKDDWGFSEAIGLSTPYFFDASHDKKHFVKDLIALGEYYIKSSPKAVGYLRLFLQSRETKVEKPFYVEEDFFQNLKKDPFLFQPEDLPLEAVRALLRLNQVIAKYFSANELLQGLMERALLHKAVPQLLSCEQKLEEKFLSGEMDFISFIEQIRMILRPYKAGDVD